MVPRASIVTIERGCEEGQQSCGRVGEKAATVRGSDREVTNDSETGGISLATPVSSQDDNNKDTEVRCMSVRPQETPPSGQRADDKAADTPNPNATSAGPVEPAGLKSHKYHDNASTVTLQRTPCDKESHGEDRRAVDAEREGREVDERTRTTNDEPEGRA
ncbi:hypothetical protein J3R82DRAFT_6794 [Butyriboletus roseoflavus]|nr:hypothetical protein J3R82DRAFT_6794 [Butyriboletus roseoflavus]